MSKERLHNTGIGSEEEELFEFLSCPASYRADDDPVSMIETHAARVFLSGDKAFKIKKRVKLPYLDFTSIEARQKALQRELELNKPHAPEIYQSVVPIGRAADGTLRLNGGVAIIDYALEMHRFDQACVIGRIADERRLPTPLCEALAEMVVDYHRSAPEVSGSSSSQAMRSTLARVVKAIVAARDIFEVSATVRFEEQSVLQLHMVSKLLAARAENRAVRRCHGDLHLENIVLLSGKPVPFDALEFDESLAAIDLFYDLAFLLMDLDFRGDRNAANIVLNRYVSAAPQGQEIEGLATLPLFLSVRAAIRAIVSLERARQRHDGLSSHEAHVARRYLAAANAYLAPPKPCLIAVGGLSGTGKSTLAASLSSMIGPAPGALRLRSDIERKRLFGVAENCRLGPEQYTQAASDKVYSILIEKADQALAAGHSVIVDAVSAKPTERTAIENVARRRRCRFAGLWLEAPVSSLLDRVSARHGDASDADAAVVRQQMQINLGDISWTRINAARASDDARASAIAHLKSYGVIE